MSHFSFESACGHSPLDTIGNPFFFQSLTNGRLRPRSNLARARQKGEADLSYNALGFVGLSCSFYPHLCVGCLFFFSALLLLRCLTALSHSYLSQPHLSHSHLSRSHLSRSYLSDSHLSCSHLSRSHLSRLTPLTLIIAGRRAFVDARPGFPAGSGRVAIVICTHARSGSSAPALLVRVVAGRSVCADVCRGFLLVFGACCSCDLHSRACSGW